MANLTGVRAQVRIYKGLYIIQITICRAAPEVGYPILFNISYNLKKKKLKEILFWLVDR